VLKKLTGVEKVMKGKRSTAGGFEGNWSGSSRGGEKGKTAVVAAPVAVYGLGWGWR
jgi:hypothetical protein